MYYAAEDFLAMTGFVSKAMTTISAAVPTCKVQLPHQHSLSTMLDCQMLLLVAIGQLMLLN